MSSPIQTIVVIKHRFFLENTVLLVIRIVLEVNKKTVKNINFPKFAFLN